MDHSQAATRAADPAQADPAWQPSTTRQVVWLVGLLAIPSLAAAVGGLVTSQSVDGWYQQLARPSWTPPGWLFGPVWTLLYFLMGMAAWLVWRSGGWNATRGALGWYAVQLVLNVLWSGIFFGLEQPGLAAGEIVLLWLAIATTAAHFWRHSRWGAVLMLPYLGWTLFATALNFAIWRMNV